MRRRGLQPDMVTYGSLISAYVNATPPRGEDALQVLKIAEGAGFANTILYNKVIKAFSCTTPSQPEAVEGLIEEMKSRGVARSSITYTSLIAAHANTPEVDPTKAEKVLEEMYAEGLQASLITFTSMLKTYAQAKPPRIETMLKMICMMEENGPQPNTISYNIVMGACA